MISTHPLVSVIIPMYNAASFVAETLVSVLSSTYPNLEVIVYDDGSTDASLSIAQGFADGDQRLRVFTHTNSGVCATRNSAIAHSNGTYILPVDADDIIEPNFISEAVAVINDNADIKLVRSHADYFGEKTGLWNLPEFSLPLLARKNIISVCALYRRSDWQRVGGYCTDIPTREDWDFWISILKDGGTVHTLPFVGFHYRTHRSSKRVTLRNKKNQVIDTLNERHIALYARLFNGPLRHRRTYSRLINTLDNIFNPRHTVVATEYSDIASEVQLTHWRFSGRWGDVIYKVRNEIRRVNIDDRQFVVKQYTTPNLINRIAYGLFRSSKAERAYRNAQRFIAAGIPTPAPVAYITRQVLGLFLRESYFISEYCAYPYTFNDLINNTTFPHRDQYLAYVGQQTARMHQQGLYPLDYSGGNILLDMRDGLVFWQVVDINRMYFGNIDIDKGCRGFSRLNVEPAALAVMARAYATERGFDPQTCVALVQQYRWHKHK